MDGRMSRCPECEKKARKERAAEREAGVTGQPDRNGRIVHFSDEERKRRSELAKRLHKEGRFGGAVIGANGGKAIGRQRIADAVLDHFRQPDQQELVIKAYESNLKGKSKLGRLQAAEAIMRQEKVADERMARDRGGAVDPSSMTEDELLEFVTQGISAMVARGEFPSDFTLPEESIEEIS